MQTVAFFNCVFTPAAGPAAAAAVVCCLRLFGQMLLSNGKPIATFIVVLLAYAPPFSGRSLDVPPSGQEAANRTNVCSFSARIANCILLSHMCSPVYAYVDT